MNAPTTHNLVQGSPEWHAHRAGSFNASDAAAMLGLSPYKTRERLLAEKASGITPEVDDETQARFDRGHELEAQARPLAEQIIGEELYPVTMSRVVGGLKLSASIDGLTLGGEIAWEHKTLNNKLTMDLDAGMVPDHIAAQCEQIMLVSGADRLLVHATHAEEGHYRTLWIESSPVLRQRLIDGWQRFAIDLAKYQPSAAQPEPVASPISQLPALVVELEGRVVSTNLARFMGAADALVCAIKTNLESDQDFADAEATVKFCKQAEDRLDLVKKQALAQTADIEEIFRVMDNLKDKLRSTRSQLDKQIKARKEQLRAELVAEFHRQLIAHVDALNAGNGAHWQSYPAPALLGDAIKGLKSLSSCRNALEAKCSELRTELSRVANRLARNRESLRYPVCDWYSLFPDFAEVGTKNDEDFDALAELRIRKHRESIVETQLKASEQAEAEQAAAAAVAQAAAAQPAPKPEAARVEIPKEPVEPENLGVLLFDLTEIHAFLKERDFGAEHSRVRSILVEFCKFVAKRHAHQTPTNQEAA